MLPGEALLALVKGATKDLVLVAPFIKKPSIERVFAAIPDSVRVVTCVTRWLPEDIAAGVCDLEIFDVATARPGATLYVHPHLHAKFFRSGENCLVGSANLTFRALGWVTPSNLELLVPLRSDHPGLAEWEAGLMQASVPATAELRDRIAAQAKEKSAITGQDYARAEVGQETSDGAAPALWVPACPVPDRLWLVYNGRGEDTMVTSAFNAAQADLQALSLPAGLSKQLFEAFVAGILHSLPIFKEVEVRATAGLTDNQAHEFLTQALAQPLPAPPEQIWRTLKAWITHFFPGSYRLEVGQEVLVKGQTLQKP